MIQQHLHPSRCRISLCLLAVLDLFVFHDVATHCGEHMSIEVVLMLNC